MSSHDYGSFGQAMREAHKAEWHSFYLDYDRLARLAELCAAVKSSEAEVINNGFSERATVSVPEGESITTEFIRASQQLGSSYVDFVAELQRQVEVMRTFFAETLDDLTEQSAPLLEQAQCVAASDGERSGSVAAEGSAERRPPSLSVKHLDLEGSMSVGSPKSRRSTFSESVSSQAFGWLAVLSGRRSQVVIPNAARASLHTAIVRLHRSARNLETFAILNSTAHSKALGLFRRLTAGRALAPEVEAAASVAPERLEASERLSGLLGRIESGYAAAFFAGSLEDARGQLLLLRSSAGTGDSSAAFRYEFFSVGLYVGLATMLVVWLAWDLVIEIRVHSDRHCNELLANATATGAAEAPPYSLWDDPVLNVYQCVGSALFAYWCWGAATWMLRRARVNTPLLLETKTEPRHARRIFMQAARYTMVFSINMLVFFKIHHQDFFGHGHSIHVVNRALPLLLFLYFIGQLAYSCRTNRVIWALVAQTAVAVVPGRTRFTHTFLADWSTSLVKPVGYFVGASCFYLSGDGFDPCPRVNGCSTSPLMKHVVFPFISVLPLCLRLGQCLANFLHTRKRFPHLANAFKYVFALAVVFLGSTHKDWSDKIWHPLDPEFAEAVAWVTLFVASTLYTYSWDLAQDWDLPSKLKPSARRMIWPDRRRYILAAGCNLLARFGWTLSVMPGQTPISSALEAYIVPYLAYVEIVRRSVWSLIRLEKEHIAKKADYDKSILPYLLQASTSIPYHAKRAKAKEHDASGARTPQPRKYFINWLEVSGFIAVALSVFIVAYYV